MVKNAFLERRLVQSLAIALNPQVAKPLSKDKEVMSALILDGKGLAQQMEGELAIRVQRLKNKSNGRSPILATILVGDDPASATYVRMKGNACRRVGMESLRIVLHRVDNDGRIA